ncbi:MAG TPA: right-handed parallel beta-helix repeat-containing protein [Malonomonas sp.]
MIRTVLFLSLFLLLSGCLKATQPVVITGELQGQQYWQGIVYLRGDVVLPADAELTIAPGTQVVFLLPEAGEDHFIEHPYFPGSELIVRGQISAIGTAEAPIRFRSSDPQAGAGSWGGINIEDSEAAAFSYCSFQQADSALHARNSWMTVEHSHFFNNLVGIRFHDTDILIENNLLHDNGAAIRFHYGAPVICKNEIRDNQKGLFITSAPWGYTIENNSFLNNRPYQISLGEGVTQPVQLRNNFWGADAVTGLEPYLYDRRVDEWLGPINYLPQRIEPDKDAGIRWNR